MRDNTERSDIVLDSHQRRDLISEDREFVLTDLEFVQTDERRSMEQPMAVCLYQNGSVVWTGWMSKSISSRERTPRGSGMAVH